MKIYYNNKLCKTIIFSGDEAMVHDYTEYWYNQVPLETKNKITVKYFSDYNKGIRTDLYYTDKDLK